MAPLVRFFALVAAALLLVADLATAAPNKLRLADFGIPTLEPFKIPQLVIGDSNTDAPVNLHINFSDINVYNLSTAQFTNIVFDYETLRISSHVHVGKVYAEANYIMDGRILLIPAKGDGRGNLNLTNLEANISINGERYQKKNRDYMKIKDFIFEVTNLGKMDMQFDNLFNGDKALGNTINNLVNENWKDIWDMLETPLEEIFSYTFKEYSRRIFDRVAMDDVFLPPSS
ncbi:Hemolymph juvenile hormone-binding protein [Gryllus bimaculatus]|nr:Hemolymph juvenile hormone-binding protein [Gryllus bimaculatus]